MLMMMVEYLQVVFNFLLLSYSTFSHNIFLGKDDKF